MAMISGLFWALTANMMRREPGQVTFDVVFSWFFWATILGMVFALLPILGRPPLPMASQIVGVLPWLIPVVLLMIIPGFYIITWGVPLLNPGTVGVLFMTEVSVGAISAALFTDEPFGLREMLGVGLITAAGVTELLASIFGTISLGQKTRKG